MRTTIMKLLISSLMCLTALAGAVEVEAAPGPKADFVRGYPSDKAAQRIYDENDLNWAMQAYRFYYPTVSGAAIFNETIRVGARPNEAFGVMDTKPRHVGFTLNSDTPYAALLLDLRQGPMVIELPAGPLLGAALDIHQDWIMDMGVPGPDAGKGGKHLILPPDYHGEVPAGYYVGRANSYRVIAGMRSLPVGGDVVGAITRLKSIKVHPLQP